LLYPNIPVVGRQKDIKESGRCQHPELVQVTLTGTHEGEYMGIPPTGIKINYTAMLEAGFSEGKIVEMWGVEDMLTLMQQLGMELKPKED
jgi:hypothetical protein